MWRRSRRCEEKGKEVEGQGKEKKEDKLLMSENVKQISNNYYVTKYDHKKLKSIC